ncbi:hypothetical protein M5K25_015825 [Dendrobium thyrsiflorum]|uniref:Uncharacterized protein n=1 Tax=Dendrobium thyrsiflorum TaxID=117978 RepID=A0ABD0US75_DENTH
MVSTSSPSSSSSSSHRFARTKIEIFADRRPQPIWVSILAVSAAPDALALSVSQTEVVSAILVFGRRASGDFLRDFEPSSLRDSPCAVGTALTLVSGSTNAPQQIWCASEADHVDGEKSSVQSFVRNMLIDDRILLVNGTVSDSATSGLVESDLIRPLRFEVFIYGLRSQSLRAFATAVTEMTRQVSTENSSSLASSTLSSDIKSASLIGRLTDFSFPGFEEPAWLGRCLKVDVCAIGNAFKSNTGSVGDFHFTHGTPSNCFSIFVVFLEIAIAHCSFWVCFFSVLSSSIGGMGTFDHQFPLFASGVLLQPEKLVAYHFPRVSASRRLIIMLHHIDHFNSHGPFVIFIIFSCTDPRAAFPLNLWFIIWHKKLFDSWATIEASFFLG